MCTPVFGVLGQLSSKTDCTEESHGVKSWATVSSPLVLQTTASYNLIHSFRSSILTVVMDWILLLMLLVSKWKMTT